MKASVETILEENHLQRNLSINETYGFICMVMHSNTYKNAKSAKKFPQYPTNLGLPSPACDHLQNGGLI